MFIRQRIRYRVGLLLACFLVYGFIADSAAQMTSIHTRPEVTVRVLMAAPDADPKGIFLLYPGGLGLLAHRSGQFTGWFPRFPDSFAEQGFVAALIDVPSDRPDGTGRKFRISKAHAEDARKVIDFLSQKWPKPIFLLGHSAGGLSVTHIAITLQDRRINGIVLTASSAEGIATSNVSLEQVTYPVLRVHHRDDICSSSQAALEQGARFIKSGKVNFVEVVGGNRSGGLNCGPNDNRRSYGHYFSGKEHEVIKTVVDWAMGKLVPERIGP